MSDPNAEIPTRAASGYIYAKDDLVRMLASVRTLTAARILADEFDRTRPNLSVGTPHPLTDPISFHGDSVTWATPAATSERHRLLEDQWLAEYRLANGPMRPFLAAVLAEPRDPLARGLLGEAIREFGWDRPAQGHDARQTPAAPVTAAECLWAPDGRWSILGGVLRWHAHGLPVADVARLALPEYLYVREGLKADLEPGCSSSGPHWGVRLDFARCPCRGLYLGGRVNCGCPLGHTRWGWRCRGCALQVARDFHYQKSQFSDDQGRVVRVLDNARRLYGVDPDDPHPDDRYPDGRGRPQGYDPEYDEP